MRGLLIFLHLKILVETRKGNTADLLPVFILPHYIGWSLATSQISTLPLSWRQKQQLPTSFSPPRFIGMHNKVLPDCWLKTAIYVLLRVWFAVLQQKDWGGGKAWAFSLTILTSVEDTPWRLILHLIGWPESVTANTFQRGTQSPYAARARLANLPR